MGAVSEFGEVVTQSRLKELLRYDKTTGDFYWINSMRGIKEGAKAGHLNNSSGYIIVCVDKRSYRAHRLVWLYHYGEWPPDCLDHHNHNRSDNRLENLNPVAKADNQKNLSRNKKNTSGVTGVHYYKAYGKWSAGIVVNKKKHFLGYFDSIEDAAKARKEAEVKFGFSVNHGK